MAALEWMIRADIGNESSRTAAGFVANPSNTSAVGNPRRRGPVAPLTKGSRKPVPTPKAKAPEQVRLLAEAEKAEKAAKDAKKKEDTARDAARKAKTKEAERVAKYAEDACRAAETAEKRARQAEEARIAADREANMDNHHRSGRNGSPSKGNQAHR